MLKSAALLSAILLASCAAKPPAPSVADLAQTEWLLEDLGGKGVLDRAQATLAFSGDNKVTGNGSCNRFFGNVEIHGDSIKFGTLGSTRMACGSEALSTQESNYLAALQNAEHIGLEGPYLLIESKGLAKPLRFTRLGSKKQP